MRLVEIADDDRRGSFEVMRTERELLWLRAGLLTLVVLVGSSAAHVAGGGQLPPWDGLLGAAFLAGLLSTAMLAFEVSHRLIGARVVATTVAGQLAVHLFLMSATPAAPQHDMSSMGDPSSMQDMPGMHGAHGTMLLAHTTAAVLVGLWLARGERALLALVAALAWRGPELTTTAVPALPTRRWHAPATAPVCEAYVLRHVRRRGPPAQLAV